MTFLVTTSITFALTSTASNTYTQNIRFIILKANSLRKYNNRVNLTPPIMTALMLLSSMVINYWSSTWHCSIAGRGYTSEINNIVWQWTWWISLPGYMPLSNVFHWSTCRDIQGCNWRILLNILVLSPQYHFLLSLVSSPLSNVTRLSMPFRTLHLLVLARWNIE